MTGNIYDQRFGIHASTPLDKTSVKKVKNENIISGCSYIFTSNEPRYHVGKTRDYKIEFKPAALPRALKPLTIDNGHKLGFRFEKDVVGAYLKVKAPGTVIGCKLHYANTPTKSR